MLGQRVKGLRKRYRLSQEKLGSMVGTSPSQISLIENNRSKPSLTTATAIARALDTSLDFVTGEVDDDRRSAKLLAEVRRHAMKVAELETGIMRDPGWATTGFGAIPELDQVAGGSAVNRDHVVKTKIRFPLVWLRNEGLNAHKCHIIGVVGESMKPTLPDGCSILVNRENRDLEDGKVYVIRSGDELLVRRALKHQADRWLLSSDNPDKRSWPTMAWPENARTVGEVRWVWHSLP
ncbi:MAG: LexA family transcriptional regulator [Acidobacteria bacterium]|nr:LexA family transcriptional regulator [Acidobacteriota bacterium]